MGKPGVTACLSAIFPFEQLSIAFTLVSYSFSPFICCAVLLLLCISDPFVLSNVFTIGVARGVARMAKAIPIHIWEYFLLKINSFSYLDYSRAARRQFSVVIQVIHRLSVNTIRM